MKALITGITGTLGQEVAKRLLADGHTVIGLSRDEQKQRLLPKHQNLKLSIGDVRDAKRIWEVSRGVDRIYHFAALKCVDQLEEAPMEAFKTNVIGTENVMQAQRANRVERVILSSTDKAAYPINAYGHSKAMAERIVLQDSYNVVTRYGNVIASRGSVIPQFIKTLKEQKTVYLTHPQMTRFLIRIEDAARFVVDRSFDAQGGVKIPRMKSCFMTDLASALAEILEIPKFTVTEIGIRPGEKINECLSMGHEGEEVHSHTAPMFTRSELIDLLRPIVRGYHG